ncbi:MAG: hypothetical protein QXR48_03165 [Candidatus Woesearchaeota archaeon]
MADKKQTQGGDGYENIHPETSQQRLAVNRMVAEGWRNNIQGRTRNEKIRPKPFVKLINLNTSFCGALPTPHYAHTSPAENYHSPLLGLPPLQTQHKSVPTNCIL